MYFYLIIIVSGYVAAIRAAQLGFAIGICPNTEKLEEIGITLNSTVDKYYSKGYKLKIGKFPALGKVKAKLNIDDNSGELLGCHMRVTELIYEIVGKLELHPHPTICC